VAAWQHIFSHFGILNKEKSGNPVSQSLVSSCIKTYKGCVDVSTIRGRDASIEDAVNLPLVIVQAELRREVLAADVARELLPVHADHVPAVAGVVLKALAADVAAGVNFVNQFRPEF
jgi:hypothetical protein